MNIAGIINDYESYYGFQESPFSLAPNPDFYVETKSHQECFNVMTYALVSGEGFIKLTGEVGTGKTLLSRRLLNALDDEGIISAYIPNPVLTPEALWRAIGYELAVDCEGVDLHVVQEKIQKQLIEYAKEGSNVVLVVDEAQCLTEDSLETIRLISNLETEKKKLIQIVLFGQPELDDLLNLSRFRQLKQRITYSAKLAPLNQQSTEQYIQQRMMFAGYKGLPVFDDKAMNLLYRTCMGIPRLINILAQKSLFSAFGLGDKQVTVKHVQAAIKDTEGVSGEASQGKGFVIEMLVALLVVISAVIALSVL